MSQYPHNAFIDAAKVLACTAIVWHHLAFYGPVSNVLATLAPSVSALLIRYGRMAVEIFLVVSGYLVAAHAARPPRAEGDSSLWGLVGARFERLVVPYYAALMVVIVVNALVRPWLAAPRMVGADPTWAQLITHLFLLQGVLGQESLSAGVWYVGIDFQLFALSALLLLGVPRWLRAHGHAPQRAVAVGQGLVVALVAGSLLGFNRSGAWDNWAVYFFGAYGMGMLAYWSAHAATRRAAWFWALALIVLAVAALAVAWRGRIFLAAITAVLLLAAERLPALAQWCRWRPFAFLARISYAVFLVHFALCLAFNAAVAHWWPGSVAAVLIGMPLTYALALVAGWLLHRLTEHGLCPLRVLLRWQVAFLGVGATTAMLA